MKYLSITLNVALLIAVAILFYQVNELKNGNKTETENPNNIQVPKVFTDPSKLADAKIAYINIDSLNENYLFIADYSKNIKARQMNIESQLNSMAMKFQQDYADFQQAAQAGLRSEAELKKQQGELEQQQMIMAEKEKQLQGLADEVALKQQSMLKNVSDFIARFNQNKFDFILAYTGTIGAVLYAKPELELTNEVVKGLNEEYKSSKPAK